tara:strand:+ start:556 stop:777 length:222 start_codon:yes stop_codon:yes gene_type:complete
MIALLYFGFLFAIGGASFALMWANIQAISKMNDPIRTKRTRHPEAPEPGEEVMYVDLSREKLENLYRDDSIGS